MNKSEKKRGRPTTFHREETIERAMYCYWKEGTNGISINELCRRIKVSKPAIYRAFGGEDGLLSAVIENYISHAFKPLIQHFESDKNFHQQLIDLVDSCTIRTDMPSGCLLVKMWVNHDQLGPKSRSALLRARGLIQEMYLSLVLKAKIKGTIRSDIEPSLAAKFINTQITTVLLRMDTEETPAQISAEAKLAVSVLFV